MLKTHFIYFFLILSLFFSCSNKEEKKIEEELPTIEIPSIDQDETLLQQVDNEGRLVWQKPEEVVKLLGNIEDKTIADIGAGSGYFTFRFALKAKKVIAIDIDLTMLKIIENFKQQLPVEIQDKIETRLAKEDNPEIKNGEVDIAVIINTIGFIENRLDYLKILREALPENGRVFILDYKTRILPINAPPMDYRVALGTLESDLIKAGFDIVSSDDQTLDYQYILIGKK